MIAMKYTEEEYENNLEEIESEARDVVEDLIALYEESYYELNDWEKDFVRAMTNRPKMARMFFKRNREYGKARLEKMDSLLKTNRKLMKMCDDIPSTKSEIWTEEDKLYSQISKNSRYTYLNNTRNKCYEILFLMRLKKKAAVARLLKGLARIKRKDFELYKKVSDKSIDKYQDKFTPDFLEDPEFDEYDINDFSDYINDEELDKAEVNHANNKIIREILPHAIDVPHRKDNYAVRRAVVRDVKKKME